MESTALRLSLLLTVLALVSHCMHAMGENLQVLVAIVVTIIIYCITQVCMLTSANPIGNPVRPKRQAVTNTRTWTVSEWSPVSYMYTVKKWGVIN